MVRNLREGHLHSIYTIYTIVYIIYTVLFPESDDIGGNQGKLYCGKELEGRTFTTRSNAVRLDFTTDESLSFYGFRAHIKFVPMKSK